MKISLLKNELQELVTITINSNAVKGIVDILTSLVKVLNAVTEFINPITILMGLFTGIAHVKGFELFKIVGKEVTDATKTVSLFKIQLEDISNALQSFKAGDFKGAFENIKNSFKFTPNESLIDETAVEKYNKAIGEANLRNAEFAEKQAIMQSAMKGTNAKTAELIANTNGAVHI